MTRMSTAKPVPTSGPQPSPAAPSPAFGVPRVPPTTENGSGWLPAHIADAREDVRRHGSELERNGASEMSIGKGMVTPWVARQARQERRYPQVDDGYGTPYRGTTPPCGGPATRVNHNHRGSRELGKALRKYG
jgi:hypothetical protein